MYMTSIREVPRTVSPQSKNPPPGSEVGLNLTITPTSTGRLYDVYWRADLLDASA